MGDRQGGRDGWRGSEVEVMVMGEERGTVRREGTKMKWRKDRRKGRRVRE